jgi:hypothetical protein
LVEAVVVDAEVVGELVEDGAADLGDELCVGAADRFEGAAEEEDAVGEGEVVAGGADGEGGALVEAEEHAAGADAGRAQFCRGGAFADEDVDVVQAAEEFGGQPVDGFADERVEAGGAGDPASR